MKTEYYSVLRVVGSSLSGGISDDVAERALSAAGFELVGSNPTSGKSTVPRVGERHVFEVKMAAQNAGTFRALRSVNNEWLELFKGRVTSLNQSDSTISRTYGCVSEVFSRLQFMTPPTPIANALKDIPPGLELMRYNGGLIQQDGSGNEYADGERVVLLDVNKIRRFKDQPRLSFNEDRLTEMGESIRNIGQLKAISVWKLEPHEIEEDGCEYELDDGERRWRSMKKIGLRWIKAIVKTGSRPTLVERFALSLVANLHNESHSPYEIAKAILYMFGELKDVTQIHQATGLPIYTIYQYLRLKTLDPELLEQMSPEIPDTERLRLEHARTLAGLKDTLEQQRIYREAYASGKGKMGVVARTIKNLVQSSGSELTFTPKRTTTRKVASRASHNLVTAVMELGHTKEGLKSHLMFVEEADRAELERSLVEAQKLLPELIAIVRSLASD